MRKFMIKKSYLYSHQTSHENCQALNDLRNFSFVSKRKEVIEVTYLEGKCRSAFFKLHPPFLECL